MTKISLFTSPKPFTDSHIDLIQKNAIRSWLALGEAVDVIIVGDEKGMSAVADEFQVLHLPDVEKNKWGTPRVDSIFHLAREVNDNKILAYLNADIILPPNFLNIIQRVFKEEYPSLIVGKRWDLMVKSKIDFDGNGIETLISEVKNGGKLHGHEGIDYFVFSRDMFTEIPPFAIGRAGWDNWMIYQAKMKGWKVIDVTPSLTVIHQEHDYSHLPDGRPHYDLEESHKNVSMGGGFRTVYDLLDVDYQFIEGRVKRVPISIPRTLRKLERWIMPDKKSGWRWKLVRQLRNWQRKCQ
jgi:hypothetical protein